LKIEKQIGEAAIHELFGDESILHSRSGNRPARSISSWANHRPLPRNVQAEDLPMMTTDFKRINIVIKPHGDNQGD
jgi:hypothetical protein